MLDKSIIEAIRDLAVGAAARLEHHDADELQGLHITREPGKPAEIRDFGYCPPDAALSTPAALVAALARHAAGYPRPDHLPDKRARQLDATTANVYVGGGAALAVLDALQTANPRYELPLPRTQAWEDFRTLVNAPQKPDALLRYLRTSLRGAAPAEFVHALKTTRWTNNATGTDRTDAATHSISREALRQLVTEAGEALPEEVSLAVRVCAAVPYVATIQCAVILDFENFRLSLCPVGADPLRAAELEADAQVAAELRKLLDAAGLGAVPVILGTLADEDAA